MKEYKEFEEEEEKEEQWLGSFASAVILELLNSFFICSHWYRS
jgi:hypothetical protein